MRQFTTPSLKITLKRKDGTIATDLEFDYLIFSIRSECFKIDKQIPFSEVQEGIFYVLLSQEETARLKIDSNVEVEVNFFAGQGRFATSIKRVKVDRNLLNRVITNG